MPVWIVILGCFTLLVVWDRLGRIRTRRIARERGAEGYSDFAAYFAGRNIPREILLNTYDYFEEWNSDSVVRFPVRATDDLGDIYGIADEDLSDGIGEILKKSGRRWFTASEKARPQIIKTVEDVVLYVSSAPPLRQ